MEMEKIIGPLGDQLGVYTDPPAAKPTLFDEILDRPHAPAAPPAKPPLLATHCGQLGDFVYTWPIAAKLHRDTGRQIHWVLPETFGPFRFIRELLELQSFTAGVTLVPHRIQHFGHGGQPYKFDPRPLLDRDLARLGGLTGEYLNFGFRGPPDKFICDFIGEEHGLGWDPDWVLNLGWHGVGGEALDLDKVRMDAMLPETAMVSRFEGYLHNAPADEVLRVLGDNPKLHEFGRLWRTLPPYDGFYAHVPAVLSAEPALYTEHANFPAGVARIDLTKPVLFNARWMAVSRARNCFYSSMAVILYFARVPFTLCRQPGHPPEDKYFPDRRRYQIHNLPA